MKIQRIRTRGSLNVGWSEDFSHSRTLQADFSATGGPASLQSAVAREATVYEFCQRIVRTCEDATMGASTFECLWFYSRNREEEAYCTERSHTVIELGRVIEREAQLWQSVIGKHVGP